MTVGQSKPSLSKGFKTEEILRRYFLATGYFVVRSIVFRYQDFSVTDVDLWLYGRHSPSSRERINVDVKNKKTPQAIERILWAAGLRDVLALDRCIVATTDRRPAVVQFGREHQITVLDGTFINTIATKDLQSERLTEEEFLAQLEFAGPIDLGFDGRAFLDFMKSRLLDRLNYDGVNTWLAGLLESLTTAIANPMHAEPLTRLSYLLTSFILLGIDSANSAHAFEPRDSRQRWIADGIRYGQAGRTRIESIQQHLESISVPPQSDEARILKSVYASLERAVHAIPVEGIAEYVSRPSISNNLFHLAMRFEASAYARSIRKPKDLESELKSIFALFVDFLAIPREKVFSI